MTKFEEEFNYLIELSGKVLIGQVDAEVFEQNRITFFEKYETDKHQPLPEVAEWYEEYKDDIDFSIFEACISLYDGNSSDFKKWFGNSGNKSIETLIRMKDGYTVQKPKRFYLKNKLTGKYLNIRLDDGTYEESDSKYHHMYRMEFTKQEIYNMQTGSYEKIEVEEEE